MGSWGTGPFDSDSAADLVDVVGAADSDGAVALVREALDRVAGGRGRHYGGEAVAAAALVAATCLG
ncbi:DUF4259 domain-containing protein [Yinghuangia soli]|uniref:DUF4259 domain-containing protein n=1 Tax=Yinghuangia soli TaxID=2908204 RepID=A0AA41Q3Z8_9ACTN|nr:DUF4259 domain-containing protein [Yinghuangia soli]MCF2530797.1 DUF4259 domain-containing protein [Yinghuangia soli]